jgi:acetyltransferase-like isoleucine patch superfamily enzyme
MIGDFFYRFFRKSYKEIRRKKILSKYEIHMSVKFWENTFITGAGEIFIGEGTYIGQNSYVSANPNGCSVRIGKNCMISHNVHIRTGSYTLRI